MSWNIDWHDEDDTGTAIHDSGLLFRITRAGWVTLMECPPSVSQLQATILMVELQRLLTDEEAH